MAALRGRHFGERGDCLVQATFRHGFRYVAMKSAARRGAGRGLMNRPRRATRRGGRVRPCQPPVAPAARSMAIRWSAMRTLSCQPLPPVMRYLPLTTSVGVLETPLRTMNCFPRAIFDATAKLFIAARNWVGFAP